MYLKRPLLSQHVIHVSIKRAMQSGTEALHSCLLGFSNLRSLHLQCYPEEWDSRRGVLSPSFVALIPRISSALTRLSVVGFPFQIILDLLRSDEALCTNLCSLALLQMYRRDSSARVMNPHPIQMIGLHELEIDNVISFDITSIETPSLLSLSVLHRVGKVMSTQHNQAHPQTLTQSLMDRRHRVLARPSNSTRNLDAGST